MQSAAALKAAVDRSHKTGRIGIITTYSGLGATVLGGLFTLTGAVQATDSALGGEGVDDGSTGKIVGGVALITVGSLAFVGGTATLSGASLSGALHLQKLAPAHSAAAGWVSVGGLGAVVGGGLISAASSNSNSQVGTNIGGLGIITALVAGHIQHARNLRQSESLALLHPRKPGPIAPTLVRY